MYYWIAIVDFQEVWDNVWSLYFLLKAVHTGDKPFKCDECDKTFRTQLELQSHMGRHTGVKPFQCDICHKEFISTITFKRHAIVHSGKEKHRGALRLFIYKIQGYISTEDWNIRYRHVLRFHHRAIFIMKVYVFFYFFCFAPRRYFQLRVEKLKPK